MRITFVMAGGFKMAGGDRVIEIYARKLIERGHVVAVVAQPPKPPSLRDRLRAIRRGRWLPLRAPPRPSHFDGSPVPHRLIDRYRPVVAADLPDADVVVATWWETAEWVAALPPEKGAKAYFIQHYEAFDGMPKARVDATWRSGLHKITISRWLVALAAEFGDDDVTFVPNSVDTEQFHAPPRGRQPIPTIGLLNHKVPWKGVGTSLAAIGRALPDLGRVQILTFGEGPFDHPLPDAVEHRHWQHPAQDSIREIYAGCDVWLCGSQAEGFHLPPLEAMACRCPVVSTAVGGPLDIIEEGRNGFLAPVGDADMLGRKLGALFALDDAEWRTMSDAAYATATAYSWDDAADRFEEGLHRATQRQASRRQAPD